MKLLVFFVSVNVRTSFDSKKSVFVLKNRSEYLFILDILFVEWHSTGMLIDRYVRWFLIMLQSFWLVLSLNDTHETTNYTNQVLFDDVIENFPIKGITADNTNHHPISEIYKIIVFISLNFM